jgi:hypothetical protein
MNQGTRTNLNPIVAVETTKINYVFSPQMSTPSLPLLTNLEYTCMEILVWAI